MERRTTTLTGLASPKPPRRTVLGLAAWQPAGGAVDEALEFDGMTFIIAGYVLNPSDGPCSVHARVKGGAPGQVLVSQTARMNLLLAEPITGCLMTEAQSGDRSSSALCSQTVITDGDWHRVGLTLDGATRSLYVDDVLVAEDTQSGTAGYSAGLNLGCGKSTTPGTFWSGLIDDVRIYNRAVKP